MANVTCTKCKAYCCTCSGCNPNTYVNGLCPNCQEELKKLEEAKQTNNA